MRKVQASRVVETLREGKRLPSSGVGVVAVRTGPPDIGASTLKQNVALVDRLRRVAIRSDPPPALDALGAGFEDLPTLELRKRRASQVVEREEISDLVLEQSDSREKLDTGAILESALPLVGGGLVGRGPSPRFVPLAISFTDEPAEERKGATPSPAAAPVLTLVEAPASEPSAPVVSLPAKRGPGDVTTDALPPVRRARVQAAATKATITRIALIATMALLAAAGGAALQRGGQSLRAHAVPSAGVGAVR